MLCYSEKERTQWIYSEKMFTQNMHSTVRRRRRRRRKQHNANNIVLGGYPPYIKPEEKSSQSYRFLERKEVSEAVSPNENQRSIHIDFLVLWLIIWTQKVIFLWNRIWFQWVDISMSDRYPNESIVRLKVSALRQLIIFYSNSKNIMIIDHVYTISPYK